MLSYLTNKIFIASQWLDELLNFSLTHKISDLHIEPLDKQYRIRLRLDGLLQEALILSKEQALPIISRIKILSHMDIAEQRLPQDGRLQYEKFSHADFRVSTCPTVLGEKCVIRNLMTMLTPLAIDELGMLPSQKNIFSHAIQQPQGLILVTGPTGSGKTVTLYSALQAINQTQKNIISIEDPVEIKLSGINQINIQPKIGLTFASTLRTMLRQDPDVIMVGEMRDKETAEIAIAAAQTGHLVFSTLHTNSAVDSFARLQQMGIESYQIASACRLIIAQRLVRTRCKACQDGCAACHEGYRGRTAVYEMVEVEPIIQRLILQTQSSDLISSHLKKQAWISMQNHATQKIAAGLTTATEARRVLGH
jgi:type IV pilus assembly protein PilB